MGHASVPFAAFGAISARRPGCPSTVVRFASPAPSSPLTTGIEWIVGSGVLARRMTTDYGRRQVHQFWLPWVDGWNNVSGLQPTYLSLSTLFSPVISILFLFSWLIEIFDNFTMVVSLGLSCRFHCNAIFSVHFIQYSQIKLDFIFTVLYTIYMF